MARPKRPPLQPRLAEFRQKRQLTQEQVAEAIGISAEMVRRHEKGAAQPTEQYRLRYSSFYRQSQSTLGLISQADGSSQVEPPVVDVVSSLPEDVTDILARIHRLEHGSVGTETLMCLNLAIDDIVSRYELAGPATLTGPLIKQRRTLETLIDDCRNPAQRKMLFRIAGKTSALLGYMAVNRERYSLARAYCAEAFQLGSFGEDVDLQAWVRGTLSFCEYYAGNYQDALKVARDGLQLADSGSQALRLKINGEARALGKLGDIDGVHQSVEDAYNLLSVVSDVPDFSPCISFGSYSRGRTASNAITAYVDLGLPHEIEKYVAIAMPEFEASDSQWSKSLIRLDLANSIAVAKDGDPEEAGALVQTALQISAANPITSVLQRSRTFVRATRKWSDVEAIANVREVVFSARPQ